MQGENYKDKSQAWTQPDHWGKREQKKKTKKHLYKYINSKNRAKENLHPLLDAAGNVTTEDKKQAEILVAVFTSVLNS